MATHETKVREEKVKAVEELAQALSGSVIAIVTDFRGVPVNAVTQLRRQLRQAGVDYKVVKNTLMEFAADKAGKPEIKSMLTGPTAIAFGHGDEVAPARVLAEFIKTSGIQLRIKGALLGDRAIDARQVAMLPAMPARAVLIAELLGKMKAPMAGLVYVAGAPLRGLVGVLQARVRQLESGQPAAA